ncbi:DUF4197 domain-containing protein [Ideonella sp. DXS22W]|uniref:DUF4197 domain-containing protein n=1 Tax=Pseudaquabacterium inlustre TaxID=2984192 RepID=A0ABU9CEN9_9BURK
MKRRDFTVGLIVPVLGLCDPARAGGFNESEAAQGIRSALQRGAELAVASLGKTDGFLGNPLVKIPLPGVLKDAARLLEATGQRRKVDELVTAMNRAAEQAVPKAKTLLVSTARSITVDDAVKIVRGGETSVTDYFSARTREPLSAQFLPIVTQATEKVALADKYNAVAGKAGQLGLLKGDDTNIQRYVTAKALDGLYRLIGEEEKKIRRDPVGTGSAILKKVFG